MKYRIRGFVVDIIAFIALIILLFGTLFMFLMAI